MTTIAESRTAARSLDPPEEPSPDDLRTDPERCRNDLRAAAAA